MNIIIASSVSLWERYHAYACLRICTSIACVFPTPPPASHGICSGWALPLGDPAQKDEMRGDHNLYGDRMTFDT